MSGKSSRTKGHSFERLIAKKLRRLWPSARRGLQYRDGSESPDVIVPMPFYIECKAHRVVNPKAALKQAAENSKRYGSYPIAITKDDHQPIMVTMFFDDWMTFAGAWDLVYASDSPDTYRAIVSPEE